jgi:hypothetical protein
VAVLEFLDEGFNVNGFIAERVKGHKNGLELFPTISIKNTFTMDNFLKRV